MPAWIFMCCFRACCLFAGGVPARLAERQARQRRIEPLRYAGQMACGRIVGRRIEQSIHTHFKKRTNRAILFGSLNMKRITVGYKIYQSYAAANND